MEWSGHRCLDNRGSTVSAVGYVCLFVCLFVCLLTVLFLLLVGLNFQAARCSSEVHELANVSASVLQLNISSGALWLIIMSFIEGLLSLVKECPLQRTDNPFRARARARVSQGQWLCHQGQPLSCDSWFIANC